MLIEKIIYLRVISIFVFNTLEIILRKEELQLECCDPFYITNEVRKIVWLLMLKLKIENMRHWCLRSLEEIKFEN